MKRSKTVHRTNILSIGVLIGLGLYGCSSDPKRDQVRNRYKTREDCIKDYDARACESRTHSDGSFFFYGPWYGTRDYGSHLSGRTTSANSFSSSSVGVVNSQGNFHQGSTISKSNIGGYSSRSISRGGFGSTARSFSVGG